MIRNRESLPRRGGRRPPGAAAALACLLLAAAALPAAGQTGARDRGRSAPPPPSLAGTAGFVDFAELGLEPPGEVKVRVAIHGPLLRLVAEATRGEEPGFAELIDKLQGVFAHIYTVPPAGREGLERKARDTARLLERRGWQTVVEVHEPDEGASYLQVRTDGERILGLAVMFFQGDGSAGLINVVGDITPEEIGRIGRSFRIEALERFDEAQKAGRPKGQTEEKP